jgi:hypothetical protein
MAIDGWAHGDLEEASEDVAFALRPGVGNTVDRCRRCLREWQVAAECRRYAPE